MLVVLDWIVFLSLFQSSENVVTSHTTPTVPIIFRQYAVSSAILAFVSTVVQLIAVFTVHIFGSMLTDLSSVAPPQASLYLL